MIARTVVVLPTYNEIETLPEVVGRLRSSVPTADILVVDDASPDGTGELADLLSSRIPQVHVLHRAEKQGLGPAYIAGFAEAAASGYEVIVQSDADGSHRPEDLPRLLDALTGADVVIGSRWMPGGTVERWSPGRLLLSRAGSAYAGTMLRLPQKDITGGYRVFRTEALDRIVPMQVESRGYCFQIEMLDRAVRSGCRVTEVPITFDDRLHGQSKMSGRIVLEALGQVTRWGIGRRLGSRRQAQTLRIEAARV
ncbi:MAG: polyprenol monophosphomannose synthase [Microbacterium sp.]|uniref:polyprenol monophosphomannose synthase n=1 Tax=Microbacterium sp. TaxID=51671 RepID=UPI001D682D77|nr:polyprenol monophosphomannose synthase [Microbacterium sp.]MBW8763435.1 polyprenol monophosphomannose synthase [Microbacterium sp.]